jgi:hypothetical protein
MIALLAALRRGLFRLVAVLLVGLLIAAFGLAIASNPLDIAGPYLALLMLPIVIAGLLLPRPFLIGTAIAAWLAGQLAVNAHAPGANPTFIAAMGNFLYATLFITVSIDQFGGTVRRALASALAHEQELETGREMLATRSAELQSAVDALQAEIVERQRLESERQAMQERLGVLADPPASRLQSEPGAPPFGRRRQRDAGERRAAPSAAPGGADRTDRSAPARPLAGARRSGPARVGSS